MKKITYLFGAGASANCLPLINGIEEGIAKMIIRFEENKEFRISDSEYFDNYQGKTKSEIQDDFISNLKWLMHECRNHASIDTYAKKLFIKREREQLRKLKVTLSVYLVFEQCLKSYDKRYDTFFASILNNSFSSLPKHLKVISWNYDYQIERAYAEYIGDYRVDSVETMLRVQNKFFRPQRISTDDFGICKLNGTANIQQDNSYSFQFTSTLDASFDLQSIESALRNYSLLLFAKQSDCFPSLSFAWENNNEDENSIVSNTKLVTKETNILVVIGYSFPFFNRQIDREIIGNMDKLEKVYFQAPDAQNLVERFESVRPDMDIKKLIPRFDTDQFLLPNEL
jgi:hypothetical protein